jgi:hypothetical protein
MPSKLREAVVPVFNDAGHDSSHSKAQSQHPWLFFTIFFGFFDERRRIKSIEAPNLKCDF